MKPRITVNLPEDGSFEVWLNPAGRDALVRELNRLDHSWDHFHLFPEGIAGDVQLSGAAQRPTDRVIEWGKVYLLADEQPS